MMDPTSQPSWTALGNILLAEENCPVCSSADGRPLHAKRLSGLEMRFWLCNACSALYARNRVQESSLSSIYGSKDFYSSGKPGGGADNICYYDFIAGEKFLRTTARGRIGRIGQHKPSGKLLEVASAAGFFLAEAIAAGYNSQGVEISAPMAEYASKRWGVPVLGQSIEIVDLPSEEFDVIASWGVMTIIRDPVALIRKFHRALKQNGVWAFNTYYHDCLWHKLVGKRWDILRLQTSQIYSKQLILDLVREEGFRLLSRRRDWPHSDVLKIADQLSQDLGAPWLVKVIQNTGVKDWIVQIPLPDVYEYIWQKI